MQPTILNFTPPLEISETVNHILITSFTTHCSERDILVCVLTNMSELENRKCEKKTIRNPNLDKPARLTLAPDCETSAATPTSQI